MLEEPFYNNQANTLFQFLEEGLYCIEFHPKFKENGLLYVSYADMWFNGATFIVEYKVAGGDPNKVDMASDNVKAVDESEVKNSPASLQLATRCREENRIRNVPGWLTMNAGDSFVTRL